MLAACTVLLVAYVALSFLGDPRGTLGTDTGGKLATLRTMERTDSWVPDVGYWASDLDPTGRLHPLYYTSRVGERWVNVTTLPMVYAARPLYAVDGERTILLLPMLGGVLCAVAARRLARLVGGGNGWTAFWTVGLCTPVAVYALDFWEHTLGLACMVLGVGLLVEVGRGDRRVAGALAAGALFGVAATLRTEALAYLAVALVVLAACRLGSGRGMRDSGAVLGAAIVGATAPLVANQGFEELVLGAGVRGTRAAGTVGAAGAGLGQRAAEAAVTSVGFNGFRRPADLLLGAVVVVLVVAGVYLLGFAGPRARIVPGTAALGLAGTVVLARFAGGLGFVPGMLIAAPLAAVGLVFGWRVRAARAAAFTVTAAVPVVWLAQYQGGARPQWGGRYILLTGVVLAVLGIVALRGRPAALRAVVALSALVTVCGVAWLGVRSHAVADGMERLLARRDVALISTVGHLLREGGAFYEPDRHWLTATSDEELRRAFEVMAGAADREVVVVALAEQPLPGSVGGYTAVGERRLEIRPREPLRAVTYRDSPSR